MTWKGFLARAVVGATLFLTLGGPAPGAVGSCTDASVTCNVANDDCQGMFCRAQLHAICERNRRGAANESHPECDDDHPDLETTGIDRTCAATASPYGRCSPPTDLAAQSCVDGLLDTGNNDLLPNDVAECAAILKCGG